MASGEYDARFLADGTVGADVNVAAVLPLIESELGGPLASLVDVGCGAGGWVHEFAAAGVDAKGWDGPWSEPNLVIPRGKFTPLNLEEPLPRDQRFELAVTIEVAEHLSPERGPGFVADLCSLADAVLFSAAIPGQPGTRHVNLRWQSHWVNLFEQHGYGAIDCIRPALWEREETGWVLAQQCFLFVRGRSTRLAMPLDVVHPGRYVDAIQPPPLRTLVAGLPGALRRSVAHHAGRTVRRRTSRA